MCLILQRIYHISISSWLCILGCFLLYRLFINNGNLFSQSIYTRQYILPQFTPYITINSVNSTYLFNTYSDSATLSILSSDTFFVSLLLLSDFKKHADFAIRVDFEVLKRSQSENIHRRCISGSISTLSRIKCTFSAPLKDNTNKKLPSSSINKESSKVRVIISPMEASASRVTILESMQGRLTFLKERNIVSYIWMWISFSFCTASIMLIFCTSCLICLSKYVFPRIMRIKNGSESVLASIKDR